MKKLPCLLALLVLLLLCAVPASAQPLKGKHIAEGGYDYVVAVQWDGTVKAAGDNTYGQCDTAQWRDVVAVDANYSHTLGLKKNGTVYAVGNNQYGQCNVQGWKDIVMIAAGIGDSYGLKRDGTVITTSRDSTRENREIAQWRDIVWINEIWGYVFAIDKDGNGYGAGLEELVIRDAVQIDLSSDGMYVLKKDGTVEFEANYLDPPTFTDPYTMDWENVTELDCQGIRAIGVLNDGMLAIEAVLPPDRDYMGWSDIAEMDASFAVKADGCVLFTSSIGLSDLDLEEVCSWKVMVDPGRSAQFKGKSISPAGSSFENSLIVTANGMRLKGQTIRFGEGSKYAVYAGPGNGYLRGGEGKALVSTDGVIQVYGVENGWALIRYVISGGKQRYGYIPALTLPKAYADSKRFKLMNLSAQGQPAIILRDTAVTDDPYASKEALCSIAAGTEGILYLGALNENWAYVQTTDEHGVPLRGFAPIQDILVQKNTSPKTVEVPDWPDLIWTNASPEHHYYDTQTDYFVAPDDTKVIVLPDSVDQLFQIEDLLMLKNLTDIQVPPDHPSFQSIDGVLYSKDGATLLFYPPGRADAEYVLPEGATSIESGCGFEYAHHLMSLVLPSTMQDAGFFPVPPALERYSVSESNAVYQAIDGVLFSRDGKALISYPAARPEETYIVPEGTMTIEDYAFPETSRIQHVIFPEGLETIGWNVFGGCEALESVVFPNTLTTIQEGAFSSCDNLKSIELPSSLKRIDHGAFAWSGLTGELRIPEGVEFIGPLAVETIPISDLYLPASLTEWELFYSYGPDHSAEDGWRGPTVHAPKGSWAAEFARQEGFQVVIEEP